MVLIPCSIPGTIGLAGKCYARIFTIPAAGPNLYMKFVDPVTGEDISPLMMNWKNLFIPQVPANMRSYAQLHPIFSGVFITSSTSQLFALSYTVYYFANESDIFSLRKSYLNIDCPSKLDAVFAANSVSVNSNMFLIDGMGLMLASSVPNTTVGNTALQYDSCTNNSNPTILAVGQFLAGKYGLVPRTKRYAISENQTLDDVTIGSTPYIVATSLFYPPTTAQTFVLVFYAPRSDFYGDLPFSRRSALMRFAGNSDTAFRNAITFTLIVAAVSIILAVVFAYYGTYPLKSLANSMESVSVLTKFDFSVLENGKLERKSWVLELSRVEGSFEKMVKNTEGQGLGLGITLD
ncbi:hypothetical protein HDU83_008910 [Entophlyctis luteolus]|nr:hypothetical protein HDU83_008910 [Entophlyctis luteolus]